MENYELSLGIGEFMKFEPIEILIDWAETKAMERKEKNTISILNLEDSEEYKTFQEIKDTLGKK
jgi:hypothetical protein